MKISNLFIPILIIGQVFNNRPNLNQPVGVQAQLVDCSTATDKMNCVCKNCYASAGLLGVVSCCNTYLTCKNKAGADINACKTVYYTCADNCAAANKIISGVSCSRSYAKGCAFEL